METRQTLQWFIDRIGKTVRNVRVNRAGEVIMRNLPDLEITALADAYDCYNELQDSTRFVDKGELFVFESDMRVLV